MRDVPYTMLELGFYENFKSVIRKLKNTEQLTQQDELAAAAVTGGKKMFPPSIHIHVYPFKDVVYILNDYYCV